MNAATADRISSLDFIRGVAVLGILAVNMASLSGPTLSGLTPHYPATAPAIDLWAFAATLVLFEGKMRALFTLLFGASMLLFFERAEARGVDGAMLQARRLGWLLVLGYLHFALIWSGDILFLYGLIGLIVLTLHEREPLPLLWGALAFYLLWHLIGGAVALSPLAAPTTETQAMLTQRAVEETAQQAGSYGAMVVQRLRLDWSGPLNVALSSLGETAPLMVIGMVLYRSGFFSGGWRRKQLRALALWSTLGGGGLTLAFLAWAWPRGFPGPAMLDYILYWSAVPHLLMALGYAALLVLIAPRAASSWIGRRFVAAGRMAFSNYIATSLVMTGLFHGWGLGLGGHFGEAGQLGFVVLGWAAMLAWSEPWLRRFRQGPLEWLWRSLTEGRRLPFRRTATS